MRPVKRLFLRGTPIVAAALAGALLSASLAGGSAPAAAQDQATTQLQQQLNSLQLTLQSRLDMMQQKIDAVEREARDMRFRLDTRQTAGLIQAVPTRSDPIPGMITNGRLVAETTESGRFVLSGAAGGIQAQLGVTSDGPGLVLFRADGELAAAFLATPDGPELRMRDADGNLQTVLPAQQ